MTHMHALYYEGHMVGWITEPKADMFHFYGGWKPADSPVTNAFVEAVQAGCDPTVVIGSLTGSKAYALALEDEIIEMRSVLSD